MEFLSNFLGAILGTGVGATVIYFAGQKFIENTTKGKFDEIDKKIKDLEDNKMSCKTFEEYKKENRENYQEFKNDYVPLKVYETAQNFVYESLKEIKQMIRTLSDKFDKAR